MSTWPASAACHDLVDGQLVRAKALAAMTQRDRLGGVQEVDDPVAGRVAAADDQHALAGELGLRADEVVHAAALPRRQVIARQLLGLEGAVAAGDDHRAAAQLGEVRVVRAQDDDVVLPVDRLDRRLEVHRDVELLERLAAQHLDEVLREDLRMAGHVEDPLLRIQRRQLAADLRQRVDDPRGRLAHPGPERRRQPDRAGADDRDVADLSWSFGRHEVRPPRRRSARRPAPPARARPRR